MSDWDETFDVIVVGAGFAGLTAAVEARTAGASVVVLEKMKAPGGNSVISDGGVAAAGTALQESSGIQDSPELFYRDMLKAGMGLNHPALVRVLTEKSAEAFQWSADYLGVQYLKRVDRFGGHSLPRCYAAEGITGATIIKALVTKAAELGVSVRTATSLSTLVTDERRVCGVVVEEGYDARKKTGTNTKRVKAERAVVVATGGFGADVPFRSTQAPRLSQEVDTTNHKFATAEALVTLLRIGSTPVHLSHIQLGPWASPDEKGFGSGPLFADYIGFLYGILVHPLTATRFVNEQSDRKLLSEAVMEIGSPCVCISDQAAVTRSGWNIDRALRKNVVQTFGTLEELACRYNLPAQPLLRTVERFNAAVSRGGDDEFGRPILTDSPPIQHPPYFAMRIWPKVHYTMGGVQIDERARVIALDHRPIQGLYAAGEVTGGVHGACRLGSCAITDCLVFGRIAGKNAALAGHLDG